MKESQVGLLHHSPKFSGKACPLGVQESVFDEITAVKGKSP